MIHDYSWFCPRITLTAGDHRYCGEPAIAVCRDCIADNGTNFDEPFRQTNWLPHESAKQRGTFDNCSIQGCRAPHGEPLWPRSRDQGMGGAPPVCAAKISKAAGRTRPVRVCVVGAIGYEKGYHNLLQCARMVAAKTCHSSSWWWAIPVTIGAYLRLVWSELPDDTMQSEAIALIEAQQADFAWLPSVWPETWCYVLTQIWEAGLYVVVNDIGAQAERVRADGGGFVVPLNLPLDRLLTVFLERRPM